MLKPHSGTVTINGQEYLYVTKNNQTTFTVNGTDDGQLRFEFVSGTDKMRFEGSPTADGVQAVIVTLTDNTPVSIRYVERNLLVAMLTN